jgi:predicted DNA-binding protein YlxM (UPF0122 family)
VIKDRPRKEVAEECGVTEAGLKNVLTKYGVKKNKLVISEEELTLYVNQKLSAFEIAEKFSCSESSVYRKCKEFGLKILAEPKLREQYDDSKDDLICSLYLDGFSSNEIGKAIGWSHTTVLHHLEHCGISRRNFIESQYAYNDKEYPKEFLNKEYMENLYLKERMSKKDIAKMFNCDPTSVDTALRKLGIPIRGNSEAHLGLMVGEKHPNWKGGLTPLHLRLREYFGVNQTKNILKRDHYCCQMCGSKKNLHVHHKKHFSDILHRIIEEHPDLNP